MGRKAKGKSTLDLTRPGIIDASAGTGKTHNIAGIYLALLLGKKFYELESEVRARENGDAPELREILVVTFTEAATAELSSRLRKRIQEELEPPKEDEKRKPLTDYEKTRLRLAVADFDDAQIFTIHAFCMRILKEFDLECGISATAEFGGEVRTERKRFAQQFLNRKRLEKSISSRGGSNGEPDDELMDTELLSSLIEEQEKVPKLVFGDDKRGALAKEAFKEWQKLRTGGDAISYNEMLTRLLGALEKDGALAKKIAARYKVALVDEFQDTDPLQWAIFRRIFIENGVPFFCVGDPKQAIYKFRGGDVQTYKSACKEISKVSGGNELTLVKNWRSSPELIAAFNEIFGNDENLEQISTEGGILDYKDAEVAPDKKTGVVPKAQENPAVFLRVGYRSTRKEDVKESIKGAVVSDVEALVEKGISHGQIAILVRTNNTGREYLNALAGRNIPATTTTAGSVLASSEAGDFESLMDALLLPNDSDKVTRAALTSFFGDYFEEAVLAGASQEDGVGAELQEFQEVLYRQKSEWEKFGFVAAFAGIANEFRCFEKLAKDKKKVTNVRHLLELINDRERRKKLTPSGLVRDFKQWRSESSGEEDVLQLRADTDKEAVCIQTIYKSKGLQYDFVFLPDLWGKDFTKADKKQNYVRTKGKEVGKDQHYLYLKDEDKEKFDGAVEKENAQSEATLFYVALTRAKVACVIYHAAVVTKTEPNKSKIYSYAEALLGKGRFLEAGTRGHVQTLNDGEELPELPLPPQEDNGEGNSSVAMKTATSKAPKEREEIRNGVRWRAREDAFGVFSFSQILGKNESISTERHGEDKNKSNSSSESNEGNEQEKDYYDKTDWYDLGAGAQFGTVVHEIFERVFKRGTNDESLKKILGKEVAKFPNFSSSSDTEKEELRGKLSAMVKATLEKEICKGTVLSNVEPKDCACEMEFYFPVEKSGDLYKGIDTLLTKFGGIYERTAKRHFKRGSDGSRLPIDGFMTGFIDLVARVGEKYFVVDWKTNRITNKDDDDVKLPRTRLEDEMVEHGYALQGLIYAVALRRFLKKVYGEGYDNAKHFGGVSFFFVRWNAVYTCEIEEWMLEDLECLICKNGTQQASTEK